MCRWLAAPQESSRRMSRESNRVAAREYALGDAPSELDRLRWQAARLQTHTDRVLRDESERSFDAIVGRLVLTHGDDPVALLRVAIERLRPGGLAAFQEADFTLSDYLLALEKEKLPLTNQVCQWIQMAREATSMN